MKMSVDWLKNYVDIGEVSVEELVSRLTLAGLEVEGTEGSSSVSETVAAKILSKTKHPDADRLNICEVTDGSEIFRVVCGAPNAREGMVTALAKIGAKLPSVTIKAARIRGVESSGMLCSEAELGGSSDHSGIVEFPESVVPGEDVNDIMGLGDTVLELNVTPNRPDWLSAAGVAREIGAVFGGSFRLPHRDLKEGSFSSSEFSYVRNNNSEKCPVYTARVIKGVKVAPSPSWLRRRLKACGIRPISNVVDVTNYVMLERGQPLHAFDLKRVKGGITVRDAFPDEKIITLDGRERVLDSDMLVIADEEKALAVAGIMGGEFSGVADDTSDILLECAYFDPETVRKTSRRLGLSSDSSYCYERGVDWGATEELADYAASMLSEICGGEVGRGRLGGRFKEISITTVKSSAKAVNAVLGTDISTADMVRILNSLEIQTSESGDELTSKAPSFRPDITRQADIAEEVGRIYGYDRIETTIPRINADPDPLPFIHGAIRNVRRRLDALGFCEAVNFSFLQPDYLRLFDKDENFVKILNPISADMAWMRTYVFPALIKNFRTNRNQGERDIRLFEFSTVFSSRGAENLADERMKFALLCGEPDTASWIRLPETDVYFYLKGILDNIFSFMRVRVEYKKAKAVPFLHPGRSAEVFLKGRKLGFAGPLHPDIAEKLDLKTDVCVAEIDFTELAEIARAGDFVYEKFSRFPSVERDLALILPSNVQAGDVLKIIEKNAPFLEGIRIFDVYSGSGIEKGYKSVAFRLKFSHKDKTLTEEEINPVIEELLSVLASEFGAGLR